MYPDLYDIFLKTKQILDRNRILNPDIKASEKPAVMTENLRFGDSYRRFPAFPTKLIWKNGFEDEAEKCHGCSKCTTVSSATRMCPVYKVVRDETASPKAKANILRGIISGALSERRLSEDRFREVTDACIQCGSCYLECPSGVNIPKLVIEARRQHIERFGKSFRDAALTSPDIAPKILSKAPRLIHQLSDLSVWRQIAARGVGMSFADIRIRQTDHLYHRIRLTEGNGSAAVLYFPGCYAAYVKPEIGTAAVRVLTQIGFTVVTPPHHCCGLPAMTKGDVDKAAGYIQNNIRGWGLVLHDVSHIVVTCSSCGLSLLQEWEAASRTREIGVVQKKLIHISALVRRRSDRLTLHPTDKTFAYHMPCHLRSQSDHASSLELLAGRFQMPVKDLKSLCCGMAGTWGMMERNTCLSRQIGSDLIRKLNSSGTDAAVTDCPTCALQIQRFTDKQVFHPIEIIDGIQRQQYLRQNHTVYKR
jgi:Fe-S oxidoreductase